MFGNPVDTDNIVGKTVSMVVDGDPGPLVIGFTDGTYLRLAPELDDVSLNDPGTYLATGDGCHPLRDHLTRDEAVALGVCAAEEYDRLRAAADRERDARDRARYEALKAKFEKGGATC